LFGSFAENRATEESDVDVAFLCDAKKIPTGLILMAWKEALSDKLKRAVDIVCLNTASPILGVQVMQNGKDIFVKDALAYDLYRARLLLEYAELKKVRKPMEDAILKRKYYD